MTEIPHMYGVLHGLHELYFLAPDRPVEMGLSADLRRELLALPRGTKVGIESTPDIDFPIYTKEGSFTLDDSTTGYWRRVEEFCTLHDLEVVFLDDMELLTAAAKKQVKSQKLTQELLDGYDDDADFWRLRRASYEAEIDSRIIHEILRERKIAENIKLLRPDVVIIGKGHGDLFATSKRVRTQLGLEILRYDSERIPDDDEPITFETSISQVEKTDRRLLIRAFHGVKDGRISPKRTPAYIGVFQTAGVYTPEEGVFEVYPDQSGQFSGTISDTFGDATFSGAITGETVQFDKRYIPERAKETAIGRTLQYTGQMKGDAYIGNYEAGMGYGNFILVPYSENMNTKEFLDRSIQEI